MALEFTVSGRIAKPVAEVFEAVADPGQLSEFFTTGGARGRLEPGAVVSWDFHDFPGAFPVHVIEVEPDRRIVLEWDAAEGAAPVNAAGARVTTVTFAFEPLEHGRTLVRISETGWLDGAKGLASSYGNCEGWTGMLCAMKVWLENGIRLRRDFYR